MGKLININYETICDYYISGMWSKADVIAAAQKGYITLEQAKEIVGE